MAAINLADMAKLAVSNNDSLKLGVIQVFRNTSKLMDMLPFETTNELAIKFLRARALPTPAFRKIGNSYSSTKGDIEALEERIYLLGGNIDIDKALERQKGIVDGRAFHEKLQLEAIARMFNHYFINGDPTSDADGITGLFYRTQNVLPASQSVNGGALDCSPDTATTTWATDLIAKIEELIDACNEGQCDALLMDRYTKLRCETAFKKSGLLGTHKDQLGRKFSTYGEGGPLLVPMGYQRDETSISAGTRIIGHVELANGTALSGGADTSIYAVKFGKDQLSGAQEYAMEVTDKGELDDGVTYRTVVDWPVGIYMPNPRAVARLYGLIML